MQFKPIDSRTDLKPDLAGVAEGFAFGLDAPSFRDQLTDGAREFCRGDLPARLFFVIARPDELQSDFGQASDGRGFGVAVAQDVAAAFDFEKAPAAVLLVDHTAPRFGSVIERQSRAQLGVPLLRFEHQAWLGTGADFLV